MRNQTPTKREKKKPKHPPAAFRESQRALEANIYSEGFQHGYKMGLEEGRRQSLNACSH